MKKKLTLIELVIIVTVVSILVAIVGVKISDMKKDTITTSMTSNVAILQTAVDRYSLDNNGDFPTKEEGQVEVDKPQYIDLEKIYPKYIKKEVDYQKIREQYYWVDFSGKVWGSTSDAVIDMIRNNDQLEFMLPKKVEGYTVYEVNGYGQLSKVNLKTFKPVHSRKIDGGNNQTHIQIPLEETNKNYLISTIDEYGLESAPAGPFYGGKGSFKPILGGSGEYEFEITSFDTMYFDNFNTVHDTPGNSSIDFSFAIQDEKGKYGSFTEDFFSLKESKGIKIKINMVSDGENKPSLYDLRVFYHFGSEKKPLYPKLELENSEIGAENGTANSIYSYDSWSSFNPIPEEGENAGGGSAEPIVCGIGGSTTNIDYLGNIANGESEGRIVYSFKLPENYFMEKIAIPNISVKHRYNVQSVSFEYSKDGASFIKVNSSSDIPDRSCVKVVYTLSISDQFTNITPFAAPEVKVSPEKATVIKDSQVNWNKVEPASPIIVGGTPEKPLSDAEINDTEWETVDTLRFFAHSGDGQATRWLSVTAVDEKPTNTRILYRYATSNGHYWSQQLDSVSKLNSSKSLMVVGYLQVHKDHIQDSNQLKPKITSIRVLHERGAVDLNLVKPTATIMPVKDNNAGRDVISEASIIDWQYETADPLGKEIVNIEWAGDKREQYPIGNYEIKLRVQNESLYWSDWISYKFEVKQEKPTAVIKMTPELIIRTNTKITWDSNSSYDSDEDGIKNVEWDNKKDVYNTAGNHTIKLRVQDNEGYWSDWVEKTFSVLDAFEVKSIAQGYDHTLFLLKNGLVKSYLTGNHNSYGQMGVNPMISKKSDITSLSNIKQVFAGQFVSFALEDDKTVKAWGYNTHGQLGVGSNINVLEPIDVPNLTNVKKIAMSRIDSRSVLFLLENGEVMVSGANNFYGLSKSDTSFKTNIPIKIEGLEGVVDVFMTQQNGYAILNDGRVKAWGVKYGYTPIIVPELTGAIEITHEYDVELALFENGIVKGRGTNKSSLFGVNTPYKTTTFTQLENLQNIEEIEIKTGSSSVSLLARSSDGIVHTLGDTSGGVLGDKSVMFTITTPIQAKGVSDTIQIEVGNNHAFALLEDGNFYWWGYLNGNVDPKIGDWYHKSNSQAPYPFFK